MSIDTTGAYEHCVERIQEAHAAGKFLWNLANHLFVSPEALVRLQREGKFLWGAVNWTLVDPDGIEVTQWGSGYRK
jgi:hypothetical protein